MDQITQEKNCASDHEIKNLSYISKNQKPWKLITIKILFQKLLFCNDIKICKKQNVYVMSVGT